MDYKNTIEYLYQKTPAFHQVGADAYKPGLERSMKLAELNGYPHFKYKTIHVAGTNGKGSVAHLLAAVLQAIGYKVGLYTSPHLICFTERIRCNGAPISKKYVVDFVKKNLRFIERSKPSFFEITSVMAFDYFKHKKVDYAVIETGLGGRLDSTNIIYPILSVITGVSIEHTQYLGNTLLEIAGEKAGIIKREAPVVVGGVTDDKLQDFFRKKADECNAPIVFAMSEDTLLNSKIQPDGSWIFDSTEYGLLHCSLRGAAQEINVRTALAAMEILSNTGMKMRLNAVRNAFENVAQITGLMGRWQEVSSLPKIVCDIGHNPGAWAVNVPQIARESARHDRTHIVFGASSDKDIDGMMSLMPKDATYYFTQASGQRAMPAETLAEKGAQHGLSNAFFPSVKEAVYAALTNAQKRDFIFISGSVFVVAEALLLFPDSINNNILK